MRRPLPLLLLVLLAACSKVIDLNDVAYDPAPTCSDGQQNGSETDIDCGGEACAPCAAGKACAVDTDCAAASICDTTLCRVARSCAEILQHIPGSSDGVYSIAPGAAAPFSVVCDMTRGGGGWTLLLKANGDPILDYSASYWIDDTLLRETDLTPQEGNAKYQSFLSLPVTTLRGELDGFLYTKTFVNMNMTAREIFAGDRDMVLDYSNFNSDGGPNWSTQPHCLTFGVNIPYGFTKVRFGWSANEQDDCETNDTAIGLGLEDDDQGGTFQFGAGYICVEAECSPQLVAAGGNGLLWAK